MLQHITIETPDAERLKPLLESMIANKLYDIEHGIQLTRAKLEAFEKQYNMSTDEFKHRFTPDDLGETLDFLEWWMELEALRLLEEKHNTLKQAKII